MESFAECFAKLAVSVSCGTKPCGIVVVSHQAFAIALGTPDFMEMGVEEKLGEATEGKSDKGKGKKGQSGKKAAAKRTQEEVRKANAKAVAERVGELLVDEDGASRVAGLVLGGPGPARRLLEQDLAPVLKGIVVRNQTTKAVGKEGVLELMLAQFGKIPRMEGAAKKKKMVGSGRTKKTFTSGLDIKDGLADMKVEVRGAKQGVKLTDDDDLKTDPYEWQVAKPTQQQQKQQKRPQQDPHPEEAMPEPEVALEMVVAVPLKEERAPVFLEDEDELSEKEDEPLVDDWMDLADDDDLMLN